MTASDEGCGCTASPPAVSAGVAGEPVHTDNLADEFASAVAALDTNIRV